jgi:hypothetical protein
MMLNSESTVSTHHIIKKDGLNHLKDKFMKKFNDNISLVLSFISILGVIVTGTLHVAGTEKINAVQEAQIYAINKGMEDFKNSTNQRFDKLEDKIDQLKTWHQRN